MHVTAGVCRYEEGKGEGREEQERSRGKERTARARAEMRRDRSGYASKVSVRGREVERRGLGIGKGAHHEGPAQEGYLTSPSPYTHKGSMGQLSGRGEERTTRARAEMGTARKRVTKAAPRRKRSGPQRERKRHAFSRHRAVKRPRYSSAAGRSANQRGIQALV
jgi:hypothetical protein